MNRPTRTICITALAFLGTCVSAFGQQVSDRDIENLGSDSMDAVKKARAAIIDAIDDPNLATGDRIDASDKLIGPLQELIESEDEIMVVNGLMIAGNIVTPESIGLIESAFDSDKPGVRYAGLKALRSTFQILGGQRTASISKSEADQQIDRAMEILKSDPDNFVAEGAARALIQAAKMRDNRLSSQAERGFKALAEGTAARMNNIDEFPEEHRAGVIRIVMLSTFELGRVLQSGTISPSQESVRAAAGLAGDALSHVYNRFEAANRQIGSMGDESAMLSQLVGAAENLVYSAQSELGQSSSPVALRQAFESGNDREFNRGILSIIGGSGVLTRPPFSLQADRFVASGG